MRITRLLTLGWMPDRYRKISDHAGREMGVKAIIVASGEIKPRVRTRAVWRYTLKPRQSSFGPVNFTVLVLYLLIMVGVGVWFMRRNRTTEDYFRAGQGIPWWAAACSIYATMLRTYVALPALIYSTDWVLTC